MTLPDSDYGVTPQGFNIMRLIDVKNELENLFIAEFGDVNLDPQSVFGQLIGIFSKAITDDWENLSDVYLSQYPNSASGISLDNAVALNGLTRIPAQRTSVIGAATGINGTLIPAGSLARLTGNGEIFYSTANAFITNGSALRNTINVTALTAQNYTVVISGTSYIYSLPTLTFSGPVVTGNVINAKINGINIPSVPFNTSSDQTLDDLANVLEINFPTVVLNAVRVGNTVEIIPVIGEQVIITFPIVTGMGAPTATVTLRTPASVDDVAQNLASNINSSVITGTWTSGSSFVIQSTNSSNPYSLNVGNNLQITSTTSPVTFLAQSFGPIAVPAGTLTQIVTPVAGWQSLTNFEAGILGRFQETDEELRLRRAQSIRSQGAATVESIRSRLLQEVPGVSSVTIFENVTMTQDPITALFSTDFIAGTQVQGKLEGFDIGTVTYVSSHLQVMNDLADLYENQDEISTAIVSGAGNRLLTLTMEDGQDVIVEIIPSGVGAPTVSLGGGRPPKSFEVVVEGGSDNAVALKIWQLKPAGIQTFGNVNGGAGITITDSQGNSQVIHFTRAVAVYLWAKVVLILNPQETFPDNGQSLVSNAIVAYGNSLGIGVDVFIQRVQAAVFTVSGIANVNVQLARTLNLNDIPDYVTTNIDISPTEISLWDLSRINVSI